MMIELYSNALYHYVNLYSEIISPITSMMLCSNHRNGRTLEAVSLNDSVK